MLSRVVAGQVGGRLVLAEQVDRERERVVGDSSERQAPRSVVVVGVAGGAELHRISGVPWISAADLADVALGDDVVALQAPGPRADLTRPPPRGLPCGLAEL
jgi:hypothetical protein